MHAVRAMPTTLSFHLSVNMFAFNVKSYTECHEDKKGIKKAVTGLESVPVSLARWPGDEGTCRRRLVDE